MNYIRKWSCIVAGLLISAPLMAGWIIKERSYTSLEKTKYTYQYFIQDQKLKLVEDELISIFDVANTTITFLIPGPDIYWSGTVEDFHQESRKAVEHMFREQMKAASGEEREMIRATFDYYLQTLDDTTSQNQPVLDMVIVNTGIKEKIASVSATQYGLYVNKKLKEEIWISEDIPVNQHLDMVRYNSMLKEIGAEIIGDLSYQVSQDFARILQKGLLVKTIEYTPDFTVTTEVYKIKETRIDPSEFLPPAGYQSVSLVQLGLFEQD